MLNSDYSAPSNGTSNGHNNADSKKAQNWLRFKKEVAKEIATLKFYITKTTPTQTLTCIARFSNSLALPKLLLIPLFSLFLFACDTQESLTFPQTEITKVIGNPSFTVQASGGSGTGAILYTSDNPEIARVNEITGEITILTVGITTIRATKAADEIYPQATASLILTVIDPIESPIESPIGAACNTGKIPVIAAGESGIIDALNIAKDNVETNAEVAVICKYVTEAGAGNKDGISWEHAYGVEHLRTLKDDSSIDASADKKYIYLVKAGIYTPADENGSRETSFSLKNHVAITGGWLGNAFELEGDTIFSGDLDGDDDGGVNTDDNSYHVFKHDIGEPYLDNSAILYGVTISAGNANGNADADASNWGGGMYNYRSNPVVSNTSFSGNTANRGGGGMYNSSSHPVVSNTSFSDNSAYEGGGMYNYISDLVVNNTSFSDNSAYEGGGMYNYSSDPVVSNTSFSKNTAKYEGGGMLNDISNPVVSNTSFSGNTANGGGGGMYNYYSSNPVVNNTSFSDNIAQDGGGMYNYSSDPVVSNTSFSDNTANYYGGGMSNYSSHPVVSNTSFSDNTAAAWGGGMYNSGSHPVVSNTSFSDNSAYEGGGMYNIHDSYPVVSNTSFSGNSAAQNGGGMYNEYSHPVVSNSIFWGNTAASGNQIYIAGSTSVISLGSVVLEGGIGGIEGSGVTNIKDNKIIETDPKLEDLVNNGGFVDTMALGDGSSAIDEGLYIKKLANGTYYYSEDNTTWYVTPLLDTDEEYSGVVPAKDVDSAVLLDKDARGISHQGKPDIGAYESQGVP